jgi:ribonuclease P protein component
VLSVTCARLDDDAPPRVAYAVGRRVGSAVTRNRLRRRLRAAVRDEASALEPSCVYLVGAAPAALETTYPELRNTLRAILDELRTREQR